MCIFYIQIFDNMNRINQFDLSMKVCYLKKNKRVSKSALFILELLNEILVKYVTLFKKLIVIWTFKSYYEY